MNLQLKILFNIRALKREQDQEILSFEEGLSLWPLGQGRILTAKIHITKEKNNGMHLYPLKIIKHWSLN